jgi:hypothetical protein
MTFCIDPERIQARAGVAERRAPRLSYAREPGWKGTPALTRLWPLLSALLLRLLDRHARRVQRIQAVLSVGLRQAELQEQAHASRVSERHHVPFGSVEEAILGHGIDREMLKEDPSCEPVGGRTRILDADVVPIRIIQVGDVVHIRRCTDEPSLCSRHCAEGVSDFNGAEGMGMWDAHADTVNIQKSSARPAHPGVSREPDKGSLTRAEPRSLFLVGRARGFSRIPQEHWSG